MDFSLNVSNRTLELPPVVTPTHVLNIATLQARVLWDRGAGAEMVDFSEYVRTIPPITPRPRLGRSWRPILVDPRVPAHALCQRLGVVGGESLVHFDDVLASKAPYWMWIAHDDSIHRGRPALETLRRAMGQEMGLSATEAVALVIQDPLLVKSHGIIAGNARLSRFPSYRMAIFLYEGKTTIGVADGATALARMRTPLKVVSDT